jgi:histidinol dehydrogenase
VSALFRYEGALGALDDGARARLCDRATAADSAVRTRVAGILERVRRDGDDTLFALAQELDGVALERLEVPRERWMAALAGLDRELRAALERAARNIATAHDPRLLRPVEIETEPGVMVGRRPDPLGRVGIYAPGGRACYPSTVLMCAVPARQAGVAEIVLCSPPGRDGMPAPVVLAAAELAGVTRLFAIGGAGAIAAMACGTKSVPRVDRIVGPGNAYVAEAKLQVVGQCSTEAPAGPSELLVIADGSANPHRIAAEVLAQAEHDPETCVVVAGVGDLVARRIGDALATALPAASRSRIIATALAERGALLAATSLDEAIAFANDYAPEHLLLAVADPDAAFARIRNAGAVFLGETSSVVFGDYLTGANHTLPTGGLARSYSGLSALDFVRWTSYQRVSAEAAARLSGDASRLAAAEGLLAHAGAADGWRTS